MKFCKNFRKYIWVTYMEKQNDTCETCGGDGKETCTNPDHGFYSMIYSVNCDISRIGCPCCGHDPEHKVPNGGKCEDCNGTGKILAN